MIKKRETDTRSDMKKKTRNVDDESVGKVLSVIKSREINTRSDMKKKKKEEILTSPLGKNNWCAWLESI